jgi:hypothetical protein
MAEELPPPPEAEPDEHDINEFEDDVGVPKPVPPDDYLEAHDNDAKQAEQAFVADIRKRFDDDYAADEQNRRAAKEDFEFVAGEQWGDRVERKRKSAHKPVLTVNRLPAFVGQVLGNRRLAETSIHVHPDRNGTEEAAKVRQGIIRAIERFSRAQVAYNKAHENQVIGGEGNFQIVFKESDDDLFSQDAVIEPIPDPFAVVWDRSSVEPTGRDATWCYVYDYITEDEFRASYPDARIQDLSTDFAARAQATTGNNFSGWWTQGMVRIMSVWRMRWRDRVLVLVRRLDPETGQPIGNEVLDVTDDPQGEWRARVVRDENGRPYIRRVRDRYAQMYITNGLELLEGPFDYPIDRIPVFRAIGWELFVDRRRMRWGLIRFLKDPQRLHNYWRSVIAEKLMGAPKNEWLATKEAVEGLEDRFRNAAKSDDPLLVYNGDAGVPPQKMPPIEVETALIQEAGMSAQDLRDVSNLHEASLGQISNEVSGRAIMARQRVGETGTLIYQQNLNLAIEECGRVLNELIPSLYPIERRVLVLGEEDEVRSELINAEGGVAVGSGKYAVTITTGPSFATKRIEAQEGMLNMVNAMPQTMAVAADKIVEAQDWPGAEEIARRLRSQLPNNLINMESLSPEERQQRQARAQAEQQQAQLVQAGAQADVVMKQAQGAEHTARAREAQARAMKTMAEINTDQMKALAEIRTDRFDSILDMMKFFFEVEQARQGDTNNG